MDYINTAYFVEEIVQHLEQRFVVRIKTIEETDEAIYLVVVVNGSVVVLMVYNLLSDLNSAYLRRQRIDIKIAF